MSASSDGECSEKVNSVANNIAATIVTTKRSRRSDFRIRERRMETRSQAVSVRSPGVPNYVRKQYWTSHAAKNERCGSYYKSVDHLPDASSLFRISIRRLALVSNSPSYPSNGTQRSWMSIPAALHFSMASYWFVRI